MKLSEFLELREAVIDHAAAMLALRRMTKASRFQDMQKTLKAK